MNTTNGINSEIQQKINRALVIDLLRKEGVCSRAKLAGTSKLRRTTITKIINDFIGCGLVIETGILSGEKNRRSIGIKLNGEQFRVLGVMLTRETYYLLTMGLSGEVFDIKQYPIREDENVQKIIAGMKKSIHKIVDNTEEFETLAIGFAMPGPYKRDQGDLVFVSNLSGWDGIHIYRELQEAFSIPVLIENDANAGAFALLWDEKEKTQNKNLIYIVAGQGIGCGVVVNGEILTGEIGLAGEIGHTSINFEGPRCECGNIGCLETYCSTIAVGKKIRECIRRKEKTVLTERFTWADFVRAVNEGDAVACREYRLACRYLAVGVVNVINQLNPGVVVIGDQLAQVAPDLMRQIITDHVNETIRPLVLEGLKIEIDTSKVNPIMIGAAAIAAQTVLADPFGFVGKEEYEGMTG